MNFKTKALKVIESFELGQSLRDCFIYYDINAYQFGKVLYAYQPLSMRFASAKIALCDVMASEMLSIADNKDTDPNRSKVMIDTRKWITSKWFPKVYGDRLDLNISEVVDLRQALDTARTRVIETRAIKNIQHSVPSDQDHAVIDQH